MQKGTDWKHMRQNDLAHSFVTQQSTATTSFILCMREMESLSAV